MGEDGETTPTATQKPGRGRPKLRSSCDGCGAAKLKCDRGQPECGRCVSYGLSCVYGPLQRMGKPPRQGRVPKDQIQDQQRKEASLVIDGQDTGGPPSSSATEADNAWWDVNTIWENHNTDNGIITDGNLNLGPHFPQFAFDDWAAAERCHNSPLQDSHEDEVVATAANRPSPDVVPAASSVPASAPVRPPVADRPWSHDCLGEAREILGSLPVLNSENHHGFCLPLSSSSSSSSNSATGPATLDAGECRVPLDHVLHLNRVACERLTRLLGCSCARLPHLILLYASIISRMLSWYHQAAICIQDAFWNASAANTTSNSFVSQGQESFPATISTSASNATDWSSAFQGFKNGSSSGTSPLSTHDHVPGALSIVVPTTIASPPAGKLATGSFYVDDLRLQAALKIQLLLGEMRRTNRLIEQISSQCSGGRRMRSESTMGPSPDGLYQSLLSWLRSENVRILNMMLSKLRELNS